MFFAVIVPYQELQPRYPSQAQSILDEVYVQRLKSKDWRLMQMRRMGPERWRWAYSWWLEPRPDSNYRGVDDLISDNVARITGGQVRANFSKYYIYRPAPEVPKDLVALFFEELYRAKPPDLQPH